MIDSQQYSTLSNWLYSIPVDIPRVENSGADVVKLSDFLVRVMEPVVIKDDIVYSRLTVKIGGAGVTLRKRGGIPERLFGKDIGRKNQFLVHSGQMVVSSIDARNGASGIVPDEAEGCVVTDNFWVFDVDRERVEPLYLQLALARPALLSKIVTISHGSTNRQYITIEQFLGLRIPLPSKNEQRKFLSRYQRLQVKKTNLQAEIGTFDNQRNAVIARHLGVTNCVDETMREGVFTVSYQDLFKWNVGTIISSAPESKTVRMMDCIGAFMTKDDMSLRLDPQKSPTKKFRYIGMDGVEKQVGLLTDKPRMVVGSEVKSTSIKVPKGYVIYGKLRPYLNKYWKNDTYKTDVICSSEFLVFRPSDRLDTDYFMAILGSNFIQHQISGKLGGTRMPRLSATDFLDLEVPEPDMEEQKAIGMEVLQLQRETTKKRYALRRLTGAEMEKLFKAYGL